MNARRGLGALGKPIANPLDLEPGLFGLRMERTEQFDAAGFRLRAPLGHDNAERRIVLPSYALESDFQHKGLGDGDEGLG